MNQRLISAATAALLIALTCSATWAQAPPPPPPSALGHSLTLQSLRFLSYPGDIEGQVEFPVAGRIKIADNTSPLPRDRVYYIFNHFHNAFDATVTDLITTNTTVRSISMERHTVGVEQTIGDRFSVELRMPIFTQMSVGGLNSNVTPGNSTIGNLSVITKALLRESGSSALAAGAAITAPTGDDVAYTFTGETLRLNNEAVHVTPFVAYVSTPTRRMFWQTFAEIDFPLNGNSAEFDIPGPAANQQLGDLNPQTVFCADLSFGYWLYEKTQPNPWTSQRCAIASIVEFSYLTALEDADALAGTTSTGNTDYVFGTARNRFDVVVSTIGLHSQIGDDTTIRAGLVVPLTDGDDRFFDSEFLFQFNRRF